MTDADRTAVFPEDRRLRWRWPVAAAAAGVVAYLFSLLLALAPGFAERWYGTGLGPALARPLSRFTGLAPFAVGDLLVLLYAGWLALAAVHGLAPVLRRRRRWRNALAGGARRVVRDLGIAAVLFYLLWGWNYARPGFTERAGWPEWEGAGTAELIALAEVTTVAANEAYLALHDTADAGRPTARGDDAEDLNAALAEGWKRAATELGLPGGFALPYGAVKRPVTGALLHQLGILGMYFPFTAEANVVPGLPAMRLPASMGHEQAHQRGVTSEAEADFLGFVVTALAPGRLGRYSAAVWASGRLGNALAQLDRAEWERISAMRLPGVTRDLRDLVRFVARASPVGRRVGAAVNDRYLRANRVPGGRMNYGMATQLLIEYARQRGGVLFPGR